MSLVPCRLYPVIAASCRGMASDRCRQMSDVEVRADYARTTGYFRLWPEADIQKASIDVCVRGISRHSIWEASFPPMTRSGPAGPTCADPLDGTAFSVFRNARGARRAAAFSAPGGLFLLRDEPEFL
jgi:hypothetical protein